ncbi:DUF4232 domain-containing protein [Streptomyces anandii]|uniref:DUF4232 domain-containing protein n=1 Tax=Streptomyces anandii TaxID=285454 RepID=UPI001673E4AE|nr:DUF4232 domain-containing protein [Streptomyces anandii]GGX74541.1 lipoprotein [Streptomyces anandii JCM 4720]
MAHPSLPVNRAALLAGTAAVLGLLTACGNGGTASPPQHVSGTAAPASGEPSGGTAASASTAPGDGAAQGRTAPGPSPATTRAGGTTASTGTGTSGGAVGRCHTSQLKASVGRNDPGAGQENFPVVLTNVSGHTCTVRGYPGAAFVDAAGKQLGPDPKREAGTPTTVTLKPGRSAWAGLTFSNPGVSGAKTATPAALIVTPPDERDHLTVPWKAGPVPVGGNASSVFLTVLSPGTAP